jgi:hypothetical protein
MPRSVGARDPGTDGLTTNSPARFPRPQYAGSPSPSRTNPKTQSLWALAVEMREVIAGAIVLEHSGQIHCCSSIIATSARRTYHRVCALSNAFHAARCVACHGVRSHPVPVALVGECSIPVVWKVARQPRSSYCVSCMSKP